MDSTIGSDYDAGNLAGGVGGSPGTFKVVSGKGVMGRVEPRSRQWVST